MESQSLQPILPIPHPKSKVWYDEFTLRVGDSLRRSIDNGLKNSRYGIVVLSEAFFNKEWPQRELDGVFAREVNGEKVIRLRLVRPCFPAESLPRFGKNPNYRRVEVSCLPMIAMISTLLPTTRK